MEKLKNTELNRKKDIIQRVLAIIMGSVAGIINGMFGGGGGMIIVPMLEYMLNCSPKKAHATALLIMLPLSVTSGLFYASSGNFNLNIGLPVGAGVIAGGVIGALLLSKLSSDWTVIIFSVVMAVAGIKMLVF